MTMFDPGFPVFGLYFRRYAPFARFGRANPYSLGFGTFSGDNRSVSTSLNVTSRTYGVVMFNRFGIGHTFANADRTHFHPTIGSVVVGTSKVSKTVVRTTLQGPDQFGFRASTAGNNPLIKPSPDINTFVDAEFDFGTPTKLKIRGEVFGDNFPNLEVFLLCYRSSHTALLLDGRTSGSASAGPATRLLTSHEWFSLGKFSSELSLDKNGELSLNSMVAPMALKEYAHTLRQRT